MPHPKNRLKLTGDTHLPDIRDLDLPGDTEEIEIAVVQIDAQPRVYADGWMPEAQDALTEEQHGLPEPLVRAEQAVQRQVVSTPWLAIGAALAFGFAVAKMLRR
jgi:hypothetical protein